ncbi:MULTISPECIES: beta-ketoacyl-ACP synthase II [unclassified Oceanobacter]|uniref:beta-ketoacyl-ACP synthase II n=1 Tax=unclassified Oceanobacter TaxID=2620260 RepID=UPI0026E283E9|nr:MULTISPECIES: beta-ketoacyl-ACP synthase II [unclassified Oceanobacter]MDO6681045.1 beta-ketoacyl-ACP synthase II [Oceanobacter sp. 5_MG-2023]MDP2504383.1 beta-ketoacyl-ACP synthase II [Oceanobacter sp. 3_MG-2023]MDP2548279.1 beta-ketoacyl-ACP synthase II [Oceanobacter sp. 4_MG-2023]MDP2608706.1 beta-ketoacyl-ACP synthase II [Oceanobacter sp. 1_MG-2023]MDP2611802.1 beta-ketoacyl-ACP synthase II [Oceanobacter sp. 2_MG-2023]
MTKRRVVVTGLGTVNPMGLDVATTWQAVCQGKSGIGPVTHFDASSYSTRIVGSVKDFDVTSVMSAKEARKLDPFLQYAMVAAEQAMQDAGFPEDLDRTRFGVAVGSGIGGLNTIEQNYQQLTKSGPRRVSPFLVPAAVINMASGNIAIRHGLQGPNFAITTACTTGTHNIGYAARTIAYGDADLMLAGGTEGASSPLGMAGFAAARAMSTHNDEPEKASRPWDKDRDGFVLSDGAAILVLESLEHAQARGAHIYAELIGLGMSDDAYHVTSPPVDGSGACTAMTNALRDGGVTPDQVDYINAHGTSTQVGDIAETNAIKTLFGDHAYKLAVSSTKSMTGHLLGAAGAIEAMFTILTIQDGIIPPTINLDNPDDGCDLDYVPHTARKADVSIALSNSFGFGGTNGSLLFSRFNG